MENVMNVMAKDIMKQKCAKYVKVVVSVLIAKELEKLNKNI